MMRLCILALAPVACAVSDVVQWSTYEVTLIKGPERSASTNPFVDVDLFATFSHEAVGPIRVRGFYDGEGVYKVRFMPQISGSWTYTTSSNAPELHARVGQFSVIACTKLGQSPVRVRDTRRFEYADGSQHFSVGTTSYAWIHQNASLIDATVKTLADPSTPFNKMRMTTFPKWYWFNHWDPNYYAYDGTRAGGWDFESFNVTFWKRFDQRVMELQEIGVEADIILFHPYDNGRWGFDCMGGKDPDNYDTTNDELYLRYIVARLGAYRNVWWSMANEWDLVKCKGKGMPNGSPTWDRLFKVLDAEDVHGHLTSIHNCVHYYDHNRSWITHISSQGGYDMAHIKRKYTPKPIVWDEVMYEGDIGNWGGLTGGQMADRYWWGLSYGIYVGHGETIKVPGLADDDQVLWWSKGGILRGASPKRIQWFQGLARKHFDSITCTCTGWGTNLCDDSCTGAHDMGDGMNLATDEAGFFFVHSSAYNQPAHRPRDVVLDLPVGNWEVIPIDFLSMKELAPTSILKGGGRIKIAAADLTFESLINNGTTAPCKRSSSSCCADDAGSCTPFMAMLMKVDGHLALI
jgi:hypothetical protein